MIDLPEVGTPPPSPIRRLVGLVFAFLAAVELVGSVLAGWNPWRLVRLDQYFGDPFFGLLLVNACALVAFWLLAPVRSEAAQPRRQMIRWLLTIALLPVLMAYGLFHRHFGIATQELAQSPDGGRRAAFVTHSDDRQLRIWTGSGLTLRDQGRAGAPCGQNVAVRFLSADLLHVTTMYGDFDVHLDHRSGRPLDHGPATCSG